MTEREKRELTKRSALLVRQNYERLLTEYETLAGSRDMVTAWGRAGGRSNKIPHPTQDRAMASMAFEERVKRMKGWFECIRGTYRRLAAREGKNPNLWRHQQLLARALQLYVFERADSELIVLMLSGGRRLSRQYVGRVLREALDEVRKDAERAGLFDQPDDAAQTER
ncbi:MAG: hypothetical protein IKS52_08950 [Clostridia bacterium]|nr:hypothetical protein [Clostridia bacterium]MBO4885953.1 hypothetical protein [Clostridia bacterium]MBR4443381.1 hypothetical protein [Clostridia bacterium]